MADSEINDHDAVMIWPLIESYAPDAKLMIASTGNNEGTAWERECERSIGQASNFAAGSTTHGGIRCIVPVVCFYMFLYPSRQEGFGLAGVEAASFEGPWLGVGGTVTAELLPTGMRAVIAKDRSKDSIADPRSFSSCLRSARLARELGRAALARVDG
jgi:hypothetical protein